MSSLYSFAMSLHIETLEIPCRWRIWKSRPKPNLAIWGFSKTSPRGYRYILGNVALRYKNCSVNTSLQVLPIHWARVHGKSARQPLASETHIPVCLWVCRIWNIALIPKRSRFLYCESVICFDAIEFSAKMWVWYLYLLNHETRRVISWNKQSYSFFWLDYSYGLTELLIGWILYPHTPVFKGFSIRHKWWKKNYPDSNLTPHSWHF